MFILIFLILQLCFSAHPKHPKAIPKRYEATCNVATRNKCEKLFYFRSSCKYLMSNKQVRKLVFIIFTLARVAARCNKVLSFCNRIDSRRFVNSSNYMSWLLERNNWKMGKMLLLYTVLQNKKTIIFFLIKLQKKGNRKRLINNK